MSKKAITILENELYLRQVSKHVKENDKDLVNDIKELEEYCKKNEVMAMASIQIRKRKKL